MTIFSKNLGGMAPLAPPWLRLCFNVKFLPFVVAGQSNGVEISHDQKELFFNK